MMMVQLQSVDVRQGIREKGRWLMIRVHHLWVAQGQGWGCTWSRVWGAQGQGRGGTCQESGVHRGKSLGCTGSRVWGAQGQGRGAHAKSRGCTGARVWGAGVARYRFRVQV